MVSENTPQVIYRRVGKAGLRVSVPILGAMGIGDKRAIPWALEEDEALPLLKAAYDRGLNTWDTSNSYSNGVSELVLGKAIKKYDLPRHKLVLMTKCCNPSREDNTPELLAIGRDDLVKLPGYVNQFGLSRQAIIASCNASLARLQTDYIDLFQIHRFDPTVSIEETMEALHDLVKSGKIRYIGASSMFTYQFVMMQECAEKHGWTKFISMQNHYSLSYREEEREMNKYCFETGVGLLPWGPLDTGRLARPRVRAETLPDNKQTGFVPRIRAEGNQSFVLSPEDSTIIDRVEEVAKAKGVSMSQVALAWILPRCSSPIGSFSTVARMDDAIAATSLQLAEEEEKYLEEPYKPKNIRGHSKWVGMKQ